jgi:hypothetical protein
MDLRQLRYFVVDAAVGARASSSLSSMCVLMTKVLVLNYKN